MNGQIVATESARISPLDHGLMVGDGVFETMVVRGGRPFAAHAHYLRLKRSCEAIGLGCISEEIYDEAIQAVLKANELREARVRVTLTSGDGPLGSDRGAGPGTAMVLATPLKPWPPTEKVLLVPWTRNSGGALAGVKSVSYGENVRALAAARAQGCGEALLANECGHLCEGTGSNLFVICEGKLQTPPLSSGCLAGITRERVLHACEVAGIACAEVDLPVSVLSSCEEAFLTSSTRDVHPIASLNGRSLVAPGPITMAVQKAFAALEE